MYKINKRRFKNSKQNQKNNLKINHKNNNNNSIIDDTDKNIIELLVANDNNASISKKLDIPLTTIQRRTRKLFEKGLVSTKIELNYEKLGYKRGLLHIYLQKGLMDKIGKNVVQKRGILSVSVHLGNSDLVALFAYRDSKDLLETIGEIKEIEGVERVLWSEEVYFITSSQPNKLFL